MPLSCCWYKVHFGQCNRFNIHCCSSAISMATNICRPFHQNGPCTNMAILCSLKARLMDDARVGATSHFQTAMSKVRKNSVPISHFQLHLPHLAWFDFFITAAVAVENASATQEGERANRKERQKKKRRRTDGRTDERSERSWGNRCCSSERV